MNLDKALDYAIRNCEIKKDPTISYGYKIDDKHTYDNYMSEESFDILISEMPEKARIMYGQGGGSELEVRKDKKNNPKYPPKMASFGSSSRFIYTLMKDDTEFCFEKQLPTTVGGTANLDGFKATAEWYVFVEAKCKEPYSVKDKIYGQKYKELYEFISASDKTLVTVDIDLNKGKEHEMEVTFKYNGEEIKHFDLKQMISHLLGISTAILKNEEYADKPIKFLYLIYSPETLDFETEEVKNKILNIFHQTCNEAEATISKELFKVILLYLKEKYFPKSSVEIDRIANNFSFSICNQENFKVKLNA